MTIQQNGTEVRELELIRAASEDVAAARMLLQQRLGALDAITRTALAHGIAPAEVALAGSAAAPGDPRAGKLAAKRA